MLNYLDLDFWSAKRLFLYSGPFRSVFSRAAGLGQWGVAATQQDCRDGELLNPE